MRRLSSLDSAADSLRRVAVELSGGGEPLLAMKGALTWGWHAVGLLSHMRLRPLREGFDAWLRVYFDEGTPALDVSRDARWEERQRLSFLELIDLLSEVELPSLKPEAYQGWQDRTVRCQALRRKIAAHLGRGLSEVEREKLLRLLAAYHRLVRLPADVELEVEPLREAFPALLDLAEHLVDPGWSEAPSVRQAIEGARAGVG